MKSFFSKSPAVFLSVFLFALIFAVGFFVGSSNNAIFGNRSASAEEKLNLEPFWKALEILDNKFVDSDGESISNEEKVYGAISGLVDSYDDPYTVFLPPKESAQFDETISGVFGGVGMEVGIREDVLTVIAPLKDSPSEKAGVKAGDKILAINGESALGMSVDDAVEKIRGEKGTEVTITFAREGESSSFDVSIVRDTIKIPNIETEEIDNIFVISLYDFSATASSEFRSALREFVSSKKSRLILDLRGNPGGFLDSAVDVSSWFLLAGKEIVTEDFGGKKENKVFRSRGYNIFNDKLKMVVLINGGSASASEIVAGALREHGIATLVGETSFGKGSVQELIELTPETSIKVTVAKWLTPNGTSISDGGLTPDVEVEITKEDFEAGIDPQLQKAIEILNK